MTDNWAARYYGQDTKGGIGTPPHNCTLFAAWMLARNGLPDPGHSWGYGDQWGVTLAADTTTRRPWAPSPGTTAASMGHVAYVARVNWSNRTVFLVSDNYAPDSAGYTSMSGHPSRTDRLHPLARPHVTVPLPRDASSPSVIR